MGIIVAIGGYDKEPSRHGVFDTPLELIDKEIIRLSKKKKPKVLFIPTASTDSEKYVEMMREAYEGKLATYFDALLLYSQKPTKKEIQAKFDWADIIYVGGGNTLKMMKKWRLLGVDQILKRAHKQGKVLCGVSAGSICWFEYGVSDSLHFYNENETKYIKVRGLGLISGVNCPHYKSTEYDNGHRSKGLHEIMKRSKGECLSVPDGAAAVIEIGKVRSIGLKKSLWCWWEKGEWCEEEID